MLFSEDLRLLISLSFVKVLLIVLPSIFMLAQVLTGSSSVETYSFNHCLLGFLFGTTIMFVFNWFIFKKFAEKNISINFVYFSIYVLRLSSSFADMTLLLSSTQLVTSCLISLSSCLTSLVMSPYSVFFIILWTKGSSLEYKL